MLSNLWGGHNSKDDDIELAKYTSSSSNAEDHDEDDNSDEEYEADSSSSEESTSSSEDEGGNPHKRQIFNFDNEDEISLVSVASEMEGLINSLEDRVQDLEVQKQQEVKKTKCMYLICVFLVILGLVWYENNVNGSDGGSKGLFGGNKGGTTNQLPDAGDGAASKEKVFVVEEGPASSPTKKDVSELMISESLSEKEAAPTPPPPAPEPEPIKPPPNNNDMDDLGELDWDVTVEENEQQQKEEQINDRNTQPPPPQKTAEEIMAEKYAHLPQDYKTSPSRPDEPPQPLPETQPENSENKKYDPFVQTTIDTHSSQDTNYNNYPEASEHGGWELHPQSNNASPTAKKKINPNEKTLTPILEQRYQDIDEGFSDLYRPYNRSRDLAIFWHIPKCGGTTLEDLLSNCIGLVEANEIGVVGGHKSDETLTVVTHDGSQYVNVDTTTQNGIKHAKELHLASSGLADVAMTSYLYDAATLFSNNGNTIKGKCFTLIRHPIERAVSLFYYLKVSTWELDYNSVFNGMSIEDYARSKWCEENWMVRFLTNEMKGPLTEDHLILAMKVLQNKCFVGLLHEFDASLMRFEMYFNWNKVGTPEKREECTKMIEEKRDNANQHPTVEEGDEVWNLLYQKNLYDMRLYEFALDLYEEFSGYG